MHEGVYGEWEGHERGEEGGWEVHEGVYGEWEGHEGV